MNKRVLIMAGGTGGHVFPGVALADALSNIDWQVEWLGTSERMEAQLVPKAGYPIHFIDVVGVRGNGLLRLLKAPFQVLKAIVQARRVIKNFAPHLVVGMGGFAAGPGGIAAWLSGIPLLIHEQNAAAGLTNRILSRFAKRVLSGFEGAFFAPSGSQKYEVVGNPVRQDFVQNPVMPPVGKRETDNTVHILVLGGSLGAKALNECVPAAMAEQSNITIRHQCGKGHLASVENAYQSVSNKDITWQVSEFIDDMSNAYQWADIVVCRAGALTVAEISAMGKAAIFVPLPHAVDDHQTKNTTELVKAQAAYLLPQTDLESGLLKALIAQVLSAPQTLVEMGKKARHLAKLDATERMLAHCVALTEKNK